MNKNRNLTIIVLTFCALITICCTKETKLASVNVDNVSYNTTDKSLIVNASIKNGGDLEDVGICYSTNSEPTINDNRQSSGKLRNFSVKITSLPNTILYLRAYAIDKFGIMYSEPFQFPQDSKVELLSISGSTLKAKLSSDGGAPIIEAGFMVTDKYKNNRTGQTTTTTQTIHCTSLPTNSSPVFTASYSFGLSQGAIGSHNYSVRAFVKNYATIAYSQTLTR